MATFAHVVNRWERDQGIRWSFQLLAYNQNTNSSDPVLGKVLADLRFFHVTDETGAEVSLDGLALVEIGLGAYEIQSASAHPTAKRLHLFFLDPVDANGNTYKSIFVLEDWKEGEVAEYISPLRAEDLSAEMPGPYTPASLQGYSVTLDGATVPAPGFSVPQTGVGRAFWTISGPGVYGMAFTDPAGTEQNAQEWVLAVGTADLVEYGVNSMASLDWVDNFATTHPLAECWEGLSKQDRERWILTASRILNSLNFTGEPSTDGQALKWPRSPEGTPKRRNLQDWSGPGTVLESESFGAWGADPVPDPVKNATAAQALNLARYGLTMDGHLAAQDQGVLTGLGGVRYGGRPRRVCAEARDFLRGWTKTW